MNGQGGSLYLRIKTDINILLTNYFNINRLIEMSSKAKSVYVFPDFVKV